MISRFITGLLLIVVSAGPILAQESGISFKSIELSEGL